MLSALSFFFFLHKALWRYLCCFFSAAGLPPTFLLFIVFLYVSCFHSFTATCMQQPGLKHHPVFFPKSSLMQQHLLLQACSVQKPKLSMSKQRRTSPGSNADVSGGVTLFSLTHPRQEPRVQLSSQGQKTWDSSYNDSWENQMPACSGVFVGCVKPIAPVQCSVSLECTWDSK